MLGKELHDTINECRKEWAPELKNFEKSFCLLTPRSDFIEHDDHYELSCDLAGVNKDEIDIDFKDGVLTIKGERKFQNDVSNQNYHRRERFYGKYQRQFELPDDAAYDSISASYDRGVLTVNIPRDQKAHRSNKILIK